MSMRTPSCGCDEMSPALACQADGLWHWPPKTLSAEELEDHRRTVAAAKARSALVDAAPDLLAVCEAVRDAKLHGGPRSLDQAIAGLDAAIAKARGGA